MVNSDLLNHNIHIAKTFTEILHFTKKSCVRNLTLHGNRQNLKF